MSDRNLVKDLKRWATEEFHLPVDSLPNDNCLKTLCVGNGKSIWKYIIQHIFQQRNVKIIRGNLQWYKVLQDKETKAQTDAVKQKEIQKKIEKLKAEISLLDNQLGETEEQLATQERSINQSWAQMKENQGRALLLQAYKQRCISNRTALTVDVESVESNCSNLEQLTRKAEIKVIFDDEPSGNNDDGNSNSGGGSEAQVLRELRQLCDDRIRFYQSLQESELKKPHSSAKSMNQDQRAAVFQYWLSFAEKVLCNHPSTHIISALQHLASREQSELDKKLAAMDVTQDLATLRFRYESDHLLDVSLEEEKELPPVKSLLQDAWEEVHSSLVELSQTRCRVKELEEQLLACRREAEHEVSAFADESRVDSLAMSTLTVELQGVMLSAARDHIRESCVQLDQYAKSRQEALKGLRSQWQSILDFRELVDVRQKQIRSLIKGNSTAKTQIIRLHSEVQQFINNKVVPQFEDVIVAAVGLCNLISKEARQFGASSLVALDRRMVDEVRLPKLCLSIHRLQSPDFSRLCHSLKFPMYKAPEDLCSRARAQHLELRFLCQLLQLYSASSQKVQRETEQLNASDQKALLSRIKEEEEKILNTLLPRARALTHRCAKGLSYGDQVKKAITYWWEKPAQHVLNGFSKGGLTFQQWLQRWKLAAKAL